MKTSSTKTLNQEKIFFESNRVMYSNKLVFFQLSLIFLLPLSAATALYPAIRSLIISKETTSLTNDIVFALFTYIVALIFSVCATGSITFTAFNGFNNEPTKLKAAIKSISASFFPLLATTLLFQAIIFVPAFLFMAAGAVLGFEYYFTLFFTLVHIITVVVYFQVNWLLAYSVVVIESKWGFEALKRSKALIDGNKRLGSTLIMIFGIYYLLYIWNNSGTGSIARSLIDGTVDIDTNFLIIITVLIIANTCYLTVAQLNVLVVTTVFYAFCMESQRDDECVSSKVNDEKVAFLV